MKYVSTAIGTVTIEIAANRPKTTPANSKPRPSEIRRARGVSGEGRLTAFNQINNNATPTSPRHAFALRTKFLADYHFSYWESHSASLLRRQRPISISGTGAHGRSRST